MRGLDDDDDDDDIVNSNSSVSEFLRTQDAQLTLNFQFVNQFACIISYLLQTIHYSQCLSPSITTSKIFSNVQNLSILRASKQK